MGKQKSSLLRAAQESSPKSQLCCELLETLIFLAFGLYFVGGWPDHLPRRLILPWTVAYVWSVYQGSTRKQTSETKFYTQYFEVFFVTLHFSVEIQLASH